MNKTKLPILALLAAITMLPSIARADSVGFTIYCTGGNNCVTSNTNLTSYWTLNAGVTTSGNNFDMTMDVTATNEPSADLLSWSLTAFSGGLTITSSTNSGAVAGKSNNGNDQCNGNVSGAVCYDLTGQDIGIPTSFDIQGTYTGNVDSTFVFLADSAFTSNDKTAFAISQDVNAITTPPPQVPEPASLVLIGSGLLLGGGGLRRKWNRT